MSDGCLEDSGRFGLQRDYGLVWLKTSDRLTPTLFLTRQSSVLWGIASTTQLDHTSAEALQG